MDHTVAPTQVREACETLTMQLLVPLRDAQNSKLDQIVTVEPLMNLDTIPETRQEQESLYLLRRFAGSSAFGWAERGALGGLIFSDVLALGSALLALICA